MNYIDLLILLPMAWAAYSGFKKGFVMSLFGLLALFAGIYAGVYLSEGVAAHVVESWNANPESAPVISFSLVFLAVLVGVYFLGRFLEGVVKATGLKPVDRVAGIFFSVSRTLLIVSALLMVLNHINHRKSFLAEEKIDGSLLWRPVAELIPGVMPMVRDTELYRMIVGPDDEYF